jgi:hypothetical protein
MSGYSRDFLIDAFMSRYINCSKLTIEQLLRLEQMAHDLYDRVGRDSFRTYASLDADAIRVYKNSLD